MRMGVWIGAPETTSEAITLMSCSGNSCRMRICGRSELAPNPTYSPRRKVVFALALAKLRALFGIERLLVKGGGHINGAMLKAGVIDELSLLLAPAVDGVTGTLALFDFSGEEADCMGGRCKMDLTSCQTLAGGVVWLRYRITPAAEAAFR
jgi:riboflavin biosynthesis pyrimidine reductase